MHAHEKSCGTKNRVGKSLEFSALSEIRYGLYHLLFVLFFLYLSVGFGVGGRPHYGILAGPGLNV